MEGKKFKNEKQQGITLIALVVTIVILLILAGIAIGTLTGDNGIIDQAHTAKEDTEIASWEEQIDLAIIDAEKKHRNPSMSDIKEELKNKGVIKDDSQVDDKTGAITTNEPSYVIEGKLDDYIEFGPGMIANKNETYTDENGETATIPKGFEILEGADTIDDGLVIQDEEGNQFVWVPVRGEYKRNTDYEFTEVSSTAYTDTGYLPEGIQPETDDATNNESAEREAVLSKGGFYISRYEAGKEGTDTLVSKAGATVWNNIAVEDNGEEKGCKTVAKDFINNDNVKSALCSGIQWDMTMEFVNGKPDGSSDADKTYDVTKDKESRHTGSPDESGQNVADRVCNIFDLEGNYSEYVAEKNSYNVYGPFVLRGGLYYDRDSASCRNIYNGAPNSDGSFRFTLYVM